MALLSATPPTKTTPGGLLMETIGDAAAFAASASIGKRRFEAPRMVRCEQQELTDDGEQRTLGESVETSIAASEVEALAIRVLESAKSLEDAKVACREAMRQINRSDRLVAGPKQRDGAHWSFSAIQVERDEPLPMPRLSSKRLSPEKKTAWPESVECYLGPTNSGKTWQSLEFLAERGAGNYAGPLRALAWEVREELKVRCARIWPGAAPTVGLWTGEEREDADDASILCCTAEVSPLQGDTLVLDEVHWCIDPARGHAWTRLLLAARAGMYRHVRICGPPEAAKLLRTIFEVQLASAAFRIHAMVRRSRLVFVGDVSADRCSLAECLRRICNKQKRFAAIVAFSRSAVLSLAGAAKAAGLRTTAIFGKLPPEARRRQLEDARAGNLDVIVTTDVIGHGVNLPIDDVIFAETRKFDGDRRRDLEEWELAQVAGRAGRGSSEGHCWVMTQYGADFDLVQKAVQLANGLNMDDHAAEDNDDEDVTLQADAAEAGYEDLDDAVPSSDEEEANKGEGTTTALVETMQSRCRTPDAVRYRNKGETKKEDTARVQSTDTAKDEHNSHDSDYRQHTLKRQPSGRLVVDHCVLSPDITVLRSLCPQGELSLTLLPNALRLWIEEFSQRQDEPTATKDAEDGPFELLPSWVRGCELGEICSRLELLAFDKSFVPKDPRRALTCMEYWALARLPIRQSNFAEIAKAAALGISVRSVKDLDALEGEDLENEIQWLGDVIVSARRFPALMAPRPSENNDGNGTDNVNATKLLQEAEAIYLEGSKRIGAHIQSCIESAFLCRNCNKPKHADNKPSDALCKRCFSALNREKRLKQREQHQASAQTAPHGGQHHHAGFKEPQLRPGCATPSNAHYSTAHACLDSRYATPQYSPGLSSPVGSRAYATPHVTSKSGGNKPLTPYRNLAANGHAAADTYAASPTTKTDAMVRPRGYYQHRHSVVSASAHATSPGGNVEQRQGYMSTPITAATPQACSSKSQDQYASCGSSGRGGRSTGKGRGKGRRGVARSNQSTLKPQFT